MNTIYQQFSAAGTKVYQGAAEVCSGALDVARWVNQKGKENAHYLSFGLTVAVLLLQANSNRYTVVKPHVVRPHLRRKR